MRDQVGGAQQQREAGAGGSRPPQAQGLLKVRANEGVGDVVWGRVSVAPWVGVHRKAFRKIRGPSATLGMTQDDDREKGEAAFCGGACWEVGCTRAGRKMRLWLVRA